ncbi:uncharacterized protein [Aegilops tauschii subsp. strangulata]|uniref:uncharacterized protein n=1 Tax=Aegilops tauschii subsp. strangulata TaxID=200361 RepID=UPI001ABC1EC2|nr:uncharacterized protein LOC109783135 isoform X3 [Aegilops tauschii subsp. strangulata]
MPLPAVARIPSCRCPPSPALDPIAPPPGRGSPRAAEDHHLQSAVPNLPLPTTTFLRRRLRTAAAARPHQPPPALTRLALPRLHRCLAASSRWGSTATAPRAFITATSGRSARWLLNA